MASALLLGTFTLLGVLVGGGIQFVLSLLAHRQATHDDRRARTRSYFAKVYGAAYMFLVYSQGKAMTPQANAEAASELLELDNLSWTELRRVDAETQEAIANLALEGGNDDVIDAYQQIKSIFAKYMNNPGVDNAEVVESFNHLRTLMQAKYHKLEKVT